MERRLRLFVLFAVAVFSITLTTASELVPRGGVCPRWSYQGEHGPAYWGDLCVNWRICSRGKEQSPIDIKNALRASSALGPIFYKYGESNTTRTKMEYNGNNVEIKWAGLQGELWKGPFGPSRVFTLNVIFFHTPSEHYISGQQMPLELQLIHLSDDGFMGVVSLLFDYGRSNPFLASVVPYLTNTTDTEVDIPTPDLNRLMKEAMTEGYYFYPGSITSPPCTQGISWVIARNVIKASASEIEAFIPILKHNVRPVQPLGERYVLEYIPFAGVDTFIFDEQSWYIKTVVAFSLVFTLVLIAVVIYICDFAIRPFRRAHKKDYSEIL